jgi:hypothetical protein
VLATAGSALFVASDVDAISVDRGASAGARADRMQVQFLADPDAPLTSPDRGPHCADDLTAVGLAAFFASSIGPLSGADYQRAIRLPDDRVLWTFQDAFVNGVLVHNAAMVQSGRCFTVLNRGNSPWLLANETSPLRRWHWILDGVSTRDGLIALFVVEMIEQGPTYLTRPQPVALRRVLVDPATFTVVDTSVVPHVGDDLYGWSITSDDRHTYLYAHCYQQFGHATTFGAAPCSDVVKVARVPRGLPDARREYWSGAGWVADAALAAPVVGPTFVGSGNNPAQIRFDGSRYVLVEKRDDWWGRTVEFGVADRPTGPFRPVASVPEPLACDRSVCNTYFATWVPWRQPDGRAIWSISRNVWNGSSASNLARYRPTFAAIDL